MTERWHAPSGGERRLCAIVTPRRRNAITSRSGGVGGPHPSGRTVDELEGRVVEVPGLRLWWSDGVMAGRRRTPSAAEDGASTVGPGLFAASAVDTASPSRTLRALVYRLPMHREVRLGHDVAATDRARRSGAARSADRPRHGYGVIGEVHELSGGRVRLRVGTLYGLLDRLVAEEPVEPDREEVHAGRVRHYYRRCPTWWRSPRIEERAAVTTARLEAAGSVSVPLTDPLRDAVTPGPPGLGRRRSRFACETPPAGAQATLDPGVAARFAGRRRRSLRGLQRARRPWRVRRRGS